MTKIDKPVLVWGLFPTFISFNLNMIFGTFGTSHHYFRRKKGWTKTIFGLKAFLAKNQFWSKNLLLVKSHFWSKSLYLVKKLFDQKPFGQKTFWAKKNFGQKTFWSKKLTFGLKSIFGQKTDFGKKILLVKNITLKTINFDQKTWVWSKNHFQ